MPFNSDDLPFVRVGSARVARAMRLLATVAFLATVALPLSAAAPPATRSVVLLAKGTPFQTPCYIQDTARPGPVVMIVGGMHGNEPAGVFAAEAVRHWPVTRGKLLVLPRANAPAFGANQRKTPDARDDPGDLNRNFPHKGKPEPPRGAAGGAIWDFVRQHKPAWLIDLHESVDYRQANKKYLGSSAIVFATKAGTEAGEAMIQAVNATIEDEKKQYTRLRSPVDGSLARAAGEHLKANAMILETGRKDTPLSTRARRHRVMVHALLAHLKMLPAAAGADVLTGPRNRKGEGAIRVALYDAGGAGGKGIPRLLKLLGDRKDSLILPIGPTEIAAGALDGFDVVIFPGGSGSKQAAAIGKAGHERVRAFVRGGGGYVGICAGAYLATSGFSWGLKILDARTVSPKWKRGTGDVKLELTDRGRALLAARTGQFDCKYANGPILKPAGLADLADYVTLAHFRTELAENGSPKGVMVDSPAICCGTFGRGRVLVSSPHPEQRAELESLVLRAVAWAAGAAEGRN